MKRNSADAFWRRVDRSGECWIWTGRTTATGYGHFDIDGRVLRVRAAVAAASSAPAPPREADIQDAIRLALGRVQDLVLWRNNQGQVERWDHRSGRTIRAHAGLPPGSPDLIGILAGRFFALEIKRPGARTSPARALAQTQFLALIRAKGGFAALVSSVDEATSAVERARRGESS